MKLISIKNKTEQAFRFNTVIKFIPGETTVISEEDYKAFPVIELLIKRGDLEIVGEAGKPSRKKKEAEDEVIEDA